LSPTIASGYGYFKNWQDLPPGRSWLSVKAAADIAGR
jgi:hypothetical protein